MRIGKYKPLYVASIINHGCFRVQKQAIPLLHSGYNLHLITGSLPSPSTKNFWKTILVYVNVEQTARAIELHKDADVFHCHNEPSWTVQLVKSIHPDKKVVLDVHDSMVLRYEDGDERQHSIDERNSMLLADGLVFVSEPMRRKVLDFYGIEKPSIVLESYVPEIFYRYDAKQFRGGVVYEGGVVFTEDYNDDPSYDYCDYRQLAQKFFDKGIPFIIYAPEIDLERMKDAYQRTAVIETPKMYHKLIHELNTYEWGLVGNIFKHPAWQLAMPNKLYDYIAAGIPIVSFNAEMVDCHVVDNDIGIAVKSVDELYNRWGEWKEKRVNVIKKGKQYTMEKHIWKLQQFYEDLL